MKEPILLLVVPKIPSRLLPLLLLKGAGCTKLVTGPRNGLEAWIDFEYANHAFEGHVDIEEWHFFADENCPEEAVSTFIERIRAGNRTCRAWWWAFRGILGR